MTRACRSCGTSIDDRPPKHFLCLRCYGDAARRLKTGAQKLSPTCAGVGFTPARVDQLIRLLDQPKRLDDAIINYGALTGRGVKAADLLTDAALAQDVTTLMADIYRREMRAKLLGWGSEG